MNTDFVFTSISVTPGHPDKLCDLISDAILDRYLIQDPAARVAAECALAGGVLFISSRAHSEGEIDLAGVARENMAQSGYRSGELAARKCSVMISQGELPAYAFPRTRLSEAGPEELSRIPASHSITLFGYACRQTPELMPLPIVLAHRLAHRLADQIGDGELGYLSPDAQAQVSVAYRDRRPVGVHSISLLASPLDRETVNATRLRDDLRGIVVEPVLAAAELQGGPSPRVLINPQGVVVGGGPLTHSGLTGRKTGIDTYGEYARNCSAALSGKDPLRIDRSGAYVARHAAKLVVAVGLAEECEVQLSYAAGEPEPLSVRVHTYGSGVIEDDEITRRVTRHVAFRPGVVAARYRLQELPGERDGFFRRLAVYGHFGREELDLPWESRADLNGLGDGA